MKFTHSEQVDISYYEDDDISIGHVFYRMLMREGEDGTLVSWEMRTDDDNDRWRPIHPSWLRGMPEEVRDMILATERIWRLHKG